LTRIRRKRSAINMKCMLLTAKMVIKELNSAQAFYYDQLDYSGYDKIINPVVIEPMVEFVLNLQVKFKIEVK